MFYISCQNSMLTLILCCVYFLMILLPPRSTRTDTLLPYTTLFRSARSCGNAIRSASASAHFAVMVAGILPHNPDGSPPFFVWTYSRSEEHTSELQSLMRISYAVFCL